HPCMPLYVLKAIRGQSGNIALGREKITFGRHPDNAVVLQDDLASRHHCTIEQGALPGQFIVTDLGSRNGTKVNDVRVKSQAVAPGDMIRIGHHEYLLEEEGADAVVASADDSKAGDDNGHEGEGKGPPAWVTELTELLNSLPPAAEPEAVAMVDSGGKSSSALSAGSDGSKAVKLLLQTSSKARATDIHFEPKGDVYHIRFRVDGGMVSITNLPNRVGELVYGLIKTACQMKLAGRDAVQEGHFSAKFPDRRVEFRVSFTPSVHAQKLVLRILDQRFIPHAIGDLGMATYMTDRIRRVCQQDHGLLLVCGPTGSGKTTTLYNALREIDRDTRNVVTIEDPVEYQLEGTTQIPADHDRGNTFGSLLRSVLRQDPDVIFVGEIRDDETARTAMQASMTGHLVFSSLHAKDTVSAVFRLLDLKVEPYLVANSLDLVLAQRLVRTLCEHCKRTVPVTPGVATRLGRWIQGKTEMWVPTGCGRCLRTGYRGRRALFELLDFNDELRDVVLKEPTITAMKKVIEQGLFTTLAQFGWKMVAEGQTSLDEIDRVAGQG
ncbi:MAG: ATPase, T2SS/T4P/T4SS family, partial [Planctomycetota bacterium]|nr:ATPase, T2SS/T4P/T4SS family [Planctomycetota bacterium]